MQARRQQRREREVRVGVGARNARLGPQVLAVADNAETARAVVVAPRQRGRRPASGGVPLVRVDGGREKNRELRGMRDVAREVVLEGWRFSVKYVPLIRPQARVDMAGAADPSVVGLGHERDGAPVL